MKIYNFKILTATLSFLVLFNCDTNKNKGYIPQSNPLTMTMASAQDHPGKALLETKCYVCHNPSLGHDSRIAPPMVAVKSHYLNADISKEAFSNAIWDFVKQPSEEKTKMRGAVRRFGIMPYQPFAEEDVKLIAEYIYDYKIDEPEWFKKHIEEESNGKMKYHNDGKSIDKNR